MPTYLVKGRLASEKRVWAASKQLFSQLVALVSGGGADGLGCHVRVTAKSNMGGGQSALWWHLARPGLRSGLSQATSHRPGVASRVVRLCLSFGVSVARPELWIPLRSWGVRSQGRNLPWEEAWLLAPSPLPVLSQQRDLCVLSSLERASYRFPSHFLNSEEKPLWQE